jgi:hypothetical protein
MGQVAHITHPARRKKTEVNNPWNFSLKPFQSLEKRPEKFPNLGETAYRSPNGWKL